MATRTRRVAIDGGFDLAGNDWYYDSGSFVSFPAAGYVTFTLPFSISLGGNGNYVSTVTLWANGVLSLGAATQAQIDFMQGGASPIPDIGNPGFPGQFFLFDYDGGAAHASYSFGIGVADYQAPYLSYEAVSAAFFSFDEDYQIIIDQNGFSVVDEQSGNSNGTNGYFIGTSQVEVPGGVIDVPYFPDFLTYTGSAGADTLTGTEFNDKFIADPGADTIDGKGGTDLVTYESSASGVTVNLALGTGAGGDAQGDTLLNIEQVFGSTFADTITGTGIANRLLGLEGNDTISGGNGNDTIEGGPGSDKLDGGLGVDTLSYLYSSGAVTVSLKDSTASGGDATGDTFVNFEGVTGSQLDDTLQAAPAGSTLSGQSGDDVLLGSSGADLLFGGNGDDFLLGGAGADRLDGGYGSDTVSFADSPAALTINLGSRTLSGGEATGDILFSIENVIGTVFADVMTGSIDDNHLEGGAGNDTLYGRSGNDNLLGGAGADTLYGDDGNDTLMGGDGDDLVYGGAGVDVLIGGTGADSVRGAAGNDILSGEDGNDILDGGAGADSMTGGAGDDTYFVDNPGDVVIEGATEGTSDRVVTSASYVLGNTAFVERLEIIGSSTAAINLTGNGNSNTLVGNSAANVLDGGGGADTMVGKGGDDTYLVDNASDLIVENSGEGTDRVLATTSYRLRAGVYVESLATSNATGTAAINLTGNELDNTITGNSGANILSGADGVDRLYGGLGDDRLYGGAGRDILSGGAGADRYYFDATPGLANADTVAGFSSVDDTICLVGTVFTAIAPGPLASSAFVVGTSAQDADDRIIYDSATGHIFYDADGNGAGAQQLIAGLSGAPTISAADFLIV